MASSVQLRNYLETLQVDPASCQGFEDEALGACIGLVGWGTARMPARMAWTRAIYAASFNTTGTLQAGPGNKSFLYTALKHRQHAAFGPFGFGDIPWDSFDVADYPWALPDPLSHALYPDVMADRGRTYERPPTWDDIEKEEKALGVTGPAGALGKKMFKSFLTKYAPEQAESAVAEWAIPVAMVTLHAGVKIENFTAHAHNEATKRAFRIDAARRDYDRIISGNVTASQ